MHTGDVRVWAKDKQRKCAVCSHHRCGALSDLRNGEHSASTHNMHWHWAVLGVREIGSNAEVYVQATEVTLSYARAKVRSRKLWYGRNRYELRDETGSANI